MEQQLAGLYGKLARQIASMIPVEWDVFYYLGEIEKGKQSWSSVFYFRETGSGEMVKSNNIPGIYQVPKGTYLSQWTALNGILLEAYQCFTDHGRDLWEQMSFSVDRTGKFKINYNYDVMNSGDGGQLARELVWAHKTFGYTPEEGTMQRKILDQHL